MKVPIPPSPKRKLGQNFLRDQNVIEKIIRFIDPSLSDAWMEIGAGSGALTAQLAPIVRRLIAVELDAALIPYLEAISGIEIIQKDIRKIDICAVGDAEKLRIVGNLPYYISTAILTHLIQNRSCIADMVLMFQEEVCDRIIAPPSDPNYGMLSVVAQYYCTIQRGFRISKNSFVPKPEIESRILRFNFRTERAVEYPEYSSFLARAFSQRRKKLRNNLLRGTTLEPQKLDSIFASMNITENARAETLSPEQFEQLILRTTLILNRKDRKEE